MPSEFSRAQLENMDRAELIEFVEAWFARIEKLQIEVHQQSALTRRLDDQLANRSQDSRPSSDGLRKPLTEVYDENRGESGWTKGTSRAHVFCERPCCFVNPYGKSRESTGRRIPCRTGD